MDKGDVAFTGAIPELYDRLLAPLIFAPYAEETARRLAGRSGEVLEVAAGTGIVTRALDRTLGADARIVATDLNAAMLAHAARQPHSDRVSWREADALALPFEDGRFSAVVCQFGAMFFPERTAGYREARRVLKPDGTYLVAIWDGLATNEVARLVHEAVTELFPEDPPGFIARTPHGHGDRDVIRREIQQAGFADVRIETVARPGRAPSARDAAIGLCQGTPLKGELAARGPDAVARATDAAAQRLRARFGDGPIEGENCAHLVTAVA